VAHRGDEVRQRYGVRRDDFDPVAFCAAEAERRQRV
jgi:hypothetical protein